MKFTLTWLKEFVEFDLSAEELADKLDLSGTAMESIEYLGSRFDKIFVGEVTAVEKHPNADRLSYCEVILDGQRAGIVCGAPNVKVGQKVPVALPGAVLPSGLEIKTTNIRGVTSEGMICSEVELELGQDAAGIMVLPRDIEAGIKLAQALNLDDWVIELEITPNRPDCMGIIGVAREVSALLGAPLKIPDVALSESEEAVVEKVKIDIADPDLCFRYTARFVDRVTIGPSPAWIRRRLEAVGIRPINNIVDVTNYVLMETGQPLHAFDFKLIKEGRIIVRKAAGKEELETIDHVARKLEPDMLVIADAERPLALAGVMGGLDSEISDATSEVLIESANFSPFNIRKTSRSLGLISESSLRFEKGVDIEGTLWAADRAAKLIAETGGGRVWAGVVDNYPGPKPKRKIRFRPERVNKVLGTEIPVKKMTDILTSLELEVSDLKEKHLEATIPSFRVDLEREVDLIEEVARIYGLNNIPSALLPSTDPGRGSDATRRLCGQLRELMVAAGFVEAVNYSFIGRPDLDHLNLSKDHPLTQAVPIRNPLSEDQALMRTSLIPSLLRTVAHNYNRGQKDLQIFEIGNVFARGHKVPEQSLMLGGVLTGNKRTPAWYEPEATAVDFYDAKGLFEMICRKLSLVDCHMHPNDHDLLQPGRSAELVSGSGVIGFIGTLHPEIQKNYGLRQDAHIFQISVEGILANIKTETSFKEIPRFPAVTLDLALVVDESVAWDKIRLLALEVGAPLLSEVKLFDMYSGPGVQKGKKSLAFNLIYQAGDRTLTDDEVAHIQKRIIERAVKELGAELRE